MNLSKKPSIFSDEHIKFRKNLLVKKFISLFDVEKYEQAFIVWMRIKPYKYKNVGDFQKRR